MSMPSATYEDEAPPASWVTCNVVGCGHKFKMKGATVDMKDFHFHKSKHTIGELLGTPGEAPDDQG